MMMMLSVNAEMTQVQEAGHREALECQDLRLFHLYLPSANHRI